MSFKEAAVRELKVTSLALTMVLCGVITFFSLCGIFAYMDKGRPDLSILSIIIMVVAARITTITYRHTRQRWKR